MENENFLKRKREEEQNDEKLASKKFKQDEESVEDGCDLMSLAEVSSNEQQILSYPHISKDMINHILSYLTSYRDLVSFSRACRIFHYLAQYYMQLILNVSVYEPINYFLTKNENFLEENHETILRIYRNLLISDNLSTYINNEDFTQEFKDICTNLLLVINNNQLDKYLSNKNESYKLIGPLVPVMLNHYTRLDWLNAGFSERVASVLSQMPFDQLELIIECCQGLVKLGIVELKIAYKVIECVTYAANGIIENKKLKDFTIKDGYVYQLRENDFQRWFGVLLKTLLFLEKKAVLNDVDLVRLEKSIFNLLSQRLQFGHPKAVVGFQKCSSYIYRDFIQKTTGQNWVDLLMHFYKKNFDKLRSSEERAFCITRILMGYNLYHPKFQTLIVKNIVDNGLNLDVQLIDHRLHSSLYDQVRQDVQAYQSATSLTNLSIKTNEITQVDQFLNSVNIDQSMIPANSTMTNESIPQESQSSVDNTEAIINSIDNFLSSVESIEQQNPSQNSPAYEYHDITQMWRTSSSLPALDQEKEENYKEEINFP